MIFLLAEREETKITMLSRKTIGKVAAGILVKKIPRSTLQWFGPTGHCLS
jgi:hypothetical protein